MYYIMNSPVITSPGNYNYTLINIDEAKNWIAEKSWVSTIGYQETADVMTELLETKIYMNRISVSMNEGDEAIVFRLKKRVDIPQMKGLLSADYVKENFELGKIIKIRD